MRCKQCQYALWNLPGRQCPECGLAFKPSEFVFARGSVAFKCPHCAQGYAGTSIRGHLEPFAFDCVRCHARITMDEMTLVPAAGVSEVLTAPLTIPWVHGAERGLSVFARWRNTVGMAIFNPAMLGEALHRLNAPARSAFRFALVTWVLIAILLFLFFLLLSIPSLAFTAGGNLLYIPRRAAENTIYALLPPFVATVAVMLCAHFVIAFVAALQRRRELRTTGGIERTFIVFCFASTAALALLLPFLGWPIYLILLLAIATPMLARAQRINAGRAALATLMLPLIGFVVFAALVLYPAARFMYGGGLAGAAGFRPPPPPPVPVVQPNAWVDVLAKTDHLAGAMRDHAALWRVYPHHPAALMLRPGVRPADFVADPSRTPNLTIDGEPIEALTGADRQRKAASSAGAFPTDTVAYRFGDMVFTHFGLDNNTILDRPEADELWLIVFAPDPAQIADPELSFAYLAAPSRGAARTIPVERWAEALTEQNELRASLGLPPLPDITALPHDLPSGPGN